MLKILAIYAVGLLVGAVSGFLPLFSLVAGYPILLVRQRMGLPQARIMALATLVITWIILDPLSFVLVGLGLAIGYSLLEWRSPDRGLGGAYKFGLFGGTVWLALSNFSALLMEERNLLSIINDVITKSFSLMYESCLLYTSRCV